MIKEFFSGWVAGLVVGVLTVSFRHGEISAVLHILACGGAVGAFAIILLSPNAILMLASLVVLPVAWSLELKTNFIGYWLFQLSVSYLGWAIFELIRHSYRLSSDSEYRERSESQKGKGGE